MKRFGDYSYAVRDAAIEAIKTKGIFVWQQNFDPNSPEVLKACQDIEDGVVAQHQGDTSADAIPGTTIKPLHDGVTSRACNYMRAIEKYLAGDYNGGGGEQAMWRDARKIDTRLPNGKYVSNLPPVGIAA